MPLATASRRRAPATDGALPPTDRRRDSRMPTSTRRGRPLLAAGGVLIVLVCAAAGASLAGRQSRTLPYLALQQQVPAGMPITAADLGTVDLDPVVGLAALPASEEASVVGQRATTSLAVGTLLAPGDLSSAAPVPSGEAIVGASLSAQQLPVELQPGDAVMLILTSSAGLASGTQGPGGQASPGARAADEPGQLLADGTVVDLVGPASGSATSGGLSSAAASDTTVVSLAVPVSSAGEVTAASAAGELSLALVPATSGGRRS
jgi:hypothetical protein